MLAAVEKGDAKKLAELMRQDPGFDVNKEDGHWRSLLHHTCYDSRRSAVIPLLLAHPNIDVNLKDKNEWTPFYYACVFGSSTCVHEVLKDSRVDVNVPNNDGYAPLWRAAYGGHLNVIQWWIASGREMDLGTPGDSKTGVIWTAQKQGRTALVTLLERFREIPEETRHQVRLEIGWCDNVAAEMFALVVFVSDGLLQMKGSTTTPSPSARFFNIAKRLPLELQMVLCRRVVRSSKEIIPGKDSEVAFKELARRLVWSSFFTD